MDLIAQLLRGFTEGLQRSNPGVPHEHLNEVAEELRRRVAIEPPPKIAIVGEAGVGKSTTINALFNAGVPVSDTRACTKRDIELTIDLSRDAHTPRHLIVYDMPGLGESIEADEENLRVYERVLPHVDVFVWVFDAQNRAIRGAQERLRNDIEPRIPGIIEKLVIGLNKVDLVAPGPDSWNPTFNLPSTDQQQNIDGREADVRDKLREILPSWNGSAVAYSAVRRYRLPSLFRAMIDAVPEGRRWVLGDRKDLASYVELVDKQVLQAIRNGTSLNADDRLDKEQGEDRRRQ